MPSHGDRSIVSAGCSPLGALLASSVGRHDPVDSSQEGRRLMTFPVVDDGLVDRPAERGVLTRLMVILDDFSGYFSVSDSMMGLR
jgi:hypothetical protein